MTLGTLLFLSVCTGGYPMVTTLPSAPDRVLLEAEWSSVRVLRDPGGTLRVEAPDLARACPQGAPDLPHLVVPVALPPRGTYEIEVQAHDVEVFLGPVATVQDSTPVGAFTSLPHTWYAVTAEGWLRTQRMVELTLFPVLSRPGGLVKAGRLWIEIRLSDPGPGEHLPEDSFAPVYRLAINGDRASPWRARPPRPALRDPVSPPQQAVKIYVNRRGLCAVTGGAIQAAGVDLASIDPLTLRLSCRGDHVPFFMTGPGGNTFSPSDTLWFFATPVYRSDRGCRLVEWWGHFTAENVYWLSWGGSPGVRFEPRVVTPTGTHPVVDWHVAIAHGEEDLMAFLSNTGDAPFPTEWFWRRWNAGPSGGTQNYTLTVDSPRQTQSGPLVRASLFGFTNFPNVHWQYHTTFALNGNSLGEAWWGEWYGRVPYCFDTQEQGVTIQSQWIRQGTNTLSVTLLPDIDPTNGPLCAAYFDWWDLRYDRDLKAVLDTLEFEAPPGTGGGTRTFRVGNVSTPDLFLLDLVRSERLIGFGYTGSTVTFEATVGDTSRFFLTSRARAFEPLRVVRERPSNPPLASGEGQASYVIITYDRESVGDPNPYNNLFDAAASLALAREHSMPTRVVDVQDIYDEFNWGILDPSAIRDFLRFAFFTWETVPLEYVLLFGDATWDYLRRSGPQAKRGFVPCWGYPISENYFVSLTEGDTYPDLHIGRLPVENAIQADRVVAKIIAYGTPGGDDEVWRKRALMVVGGLNEAEQTLFEGHAEIILRDYVLPAPFLGDADRVYRTLVGFQPGYYNRRIVDAINRGCIALNYIGHGAALTWGIMLDVTDLPSLANGMAMPVAMGLTCNSNAFGEPDTSCLGEVFLRLDDASHGAIASWGATARANEWLAWRGSLAFFNALCVNLERRLGALVTIGNLAGGSAVWSMFSLLGEPLVELPVPTGPDLATSAESLWIVPSIVGEYHDVTVQAVVENLGRASPELVTVRFASGTETPVGFASLADTCGMRRRSAYVVEWNSGPGLGPRLISVSADHTNVMTELREDNNVATLLFDALLSPPTVSSPFDCEVVRGPSVTLTVGNLPSSGAARTYEFEICRSESLVPGALGFQSSGPVPEQEGTTSWVVHGLQNGTTYFWRCKAREGAFDGAWAPTVSFTVDPSVGSGMVWLQRHGAQFSADSLQGLVVDRALNTVVLKAEVNPTDFAHVSQGASVPYVSSYNTNPYTDPLNLIGESIGSGAGLYGQFLFAYDDYSQEALIDLGQERAIALIGSEHWIGTDDRPVWSFYRISSSVDNVEFVEWGSLGPFSVPDLNNIPTPMSFSVDTPRPVRYIRFEFGAGLPHPFPGGTAWGSRIYEVFAHAVDFLPTGTLTSSVVGPASAWDTLEWEAQVPAGTSLSVTVLAAPNSSGPFTPVPSLTDLAHSPASLGAVQDPYLRLRATFSSSDPRHTPTLESWRVRFQGGVDLAFRGDLTVVPSLPPPGTLAAIEGVLCNRGNAAADSAVVSIHDATVHDTLSVGDALFTGLQPGGSRSFSVPWQSSIGRHTLTAQAHVRGASPEVAPGDNTASVVVAVLPDPACESLCVVTPSPQQFGPLLLRGFLANRGSVASDSLRWVAIASKEGEGSMSQLGAGRRGPLLPDERVEVAIEWPQPREPGVYAAVLAVHDPGEQVSTTNDTASTVVRIATAPDLLIDSLLFSNTHPPAGDPVGVRVVVRNAGESACDTTSVRIHHTSPSGVRSSLGSWNLALAGGGAATVHAVFPTSQAPGVHVVEATVDPDSLVQESDETNNTRVDSVTVFSGVDLFATGGLEIVPEPVLTRDTVTVSALVRNAGESPAGPFHLGWESTVLSFLEGDSLLQGLPPTSERPAWARFLAPSRAETGTVSLLIDSRDLVPETNEGNNRLDRLVSIVVEPDLSVRSEEIRFSPSAPTEDDTVVVRGLVRNLGEAPSGDFLVRVAHRRVATEEWRVLASAMWEGIPGGGMRELAVPWVAGEARVHHWFQVTCNPDSSCREHSLSNNVAERCLVVAPKDRDPPTISLFVTLPGFADSGFVPPTIPLLAHVEDPGSGVDTSTVALFVDEQRVPLSGARWVGEDTLSRLTGAVGPLPPGRRTLRVEAADKAGNVGSSLPVSVTVAEGPGPLRLLAMDRADRDETVFVLQAAFEEQASLAVYTSTGRLVARWDVVVVPPLTTVPWDRRDLDGDRVANGVYLARAKTASGRTASTSVAVIR